MNGISSRHDRRLTAEVRDRALLALGSAGARLDSLTVSLTEDAGRVLCEITGTARTTHWVSRGEARDRDAALEHALRRLRRILVARKTGPR